MLLFYAHLILRLSWNKNDPVKSTAELNKTVNETKKEIDNVNESKVEVNKPVHKTIEEVNKTVEKTVEETVFIDEDFRKKWN